jgi:mannonate dehydratase
MKIGLGVHHPTDERLRYARQLGADGIFLGADAAPGYDRRGYATAEELTAIHQRVKEYGLEILTLRLAPRSTFNILSGGPRMDDEIEGVCQTVRAAGAAGIPTVFFNLTPWRSLDVAWPATPGGPRPTPDDIRPGSGPGRYYRPTGRGGAVLLTHDRARAAADAAAAPPESVAPYGPITADALWDRLHRLYRRVVPVAEAAGVNIGAHPDDPPERSYRGVEQILNSVAGLQRLIDLVPSPRSGLLLCLGTLHEMGEDTMGAIDHFLEQDRVFNAHFRNPKGTVAGGYYQEDFLDEGDLDMLEVMRLFHRHDYTGSLDPDHAVGIVGDSGGRIGFAWELGYMRALRAAVRAGG